MIADLFIANFVRTVLMFCALICMWENLKKNYVGRSILCGLIALTMFTAFSFLPDYVFDWSRILVWVTFAAILVVLHFNGGRLKVEDMIEQKILKIKPRRHK